MAAGILTAGGYAGVVEACGIGKRYRGMARTAVRARHDMVCRFAGGGKDGAVMTVRTCLTGHFGAAMVKCAPGKGCRSRRMCDVAG